jgi:uncharacterized protein YdbL (DUF1318 family)
MMNRIYSIISILLMVFILSSCVTINIYFPAAAVEKAADRIVEEVWGEKGNKPEKQDKQTGPQSLLRQGLTFILAVLGPEEAYAEEPDINISTPAIRAIKESIKNRAGRIKPYLDRGNVGISKDGMLVIRSTEGLSLKEKAALKRLIKAENNDREALYREIAKANNFPPERVKDIKRIFAKSWKEKAGKGWWIESEDGKWYRK